MNDGLIAFFLSVPLEEGRLVIGPDVPLVRAVEDLNMSDTAMPVQRADVIANARRAFRAESDARTVLCSEKAWIDQSLREAGFTDPATEDEERGIGSPADPIREGIINHARMGYALEKSQGKMVLCSERAFVGQVLRDAGMVALSPVEIRSIPGE